LVDTGGIRKNVTAGSTVCRRYRLLRCRSPRRSDRGA